MTEVLRARDVRFLLYEFLDTASLLHRERYKDHDLNVFSSILEAARNIAEKTLLPHYQKADANEPQFDGERVHVLPDTKVAWDVMRESGFLKAGTDMEDGGLQLPQVIVRCAFAYFLAANGSSSAYFFLTTGVINLIRSFGNASQKELYLPGLLEGNFTGTMAMTEPSQGSALADIRTRAEPQADGSWRLFGQKIFISGGDHDLTENIIHMVLAKTAGAPPGAAGISLFIVPKYMVNPDGTNGTRNDVALAGLLHKMGCRNSVSTALSFGEKDGAIGYLIGEEGKGLACMFQMMNEARIGVGIGAASAALRGFYYSLEYAKERPQGRHPSNKNPASPQVKLTEHADIRRMLLAQKSYGEGALALCLYAASLFEDEHTHPVQEERVRAGQLLGLLTPVVKSWSSRYGCQSNDLAIQVMGGAGYMREYPVEQLYRDQRLNPIHEGAEGIHGIDILGRKIRLDGGVALRHFEQAVSKTIDDASAESALQTLAQSVKAHLDLLLETTKSLVIAMGKDIDAGMSNATIYLDTFGRVTASWIWLRQALIAQQALKRLPIEADSDFYQGKLLAARYYIEWELPAIEHQCKLLVEPNLLPFRAPVQCL